MSDFQPCCLPLLIGSVPLSDHRQAVELIFDYTPEVPLWPQLPVHRQEGMIAQFLPGFPGVDNCDGKVFVNMESASFDEEFLAFFEEYLLVTEAGGSLEGSRFALTSEIAEGFFAFLDYAAARKQTISAVKGQVTGPVTFCTGVVDQSGRAIFYNDQLRDAAVKMLALKGAYQARRLAEVARPALVFFDEPGLAGFGTSAFITITKEDIVACLGEVFAAVKREGGLCGVHVCANTEWSLLLETAVDVVSYDAFGYFDRLALYGRQLADFLARGGILATGIVPTAADKIGDVSVAGLVKTWFAQTAQLESMGIPRKTVYQQSFITPSCGTGTITEDQAKRVMALTRDVSEEIRRRVQ
ncbi:MAG: hypothetical protein ACK5PS_15940 [Desulfopila sp.]